MRSVRLAKSTFFFTNRLVNRNFSKAITKQGKIRSCKGSCRNFRFGNLSVFKSLKNELFNSEISIYFSDKAIVDELTDLELVLQLQGDSLEALDALYDRHSRLVY
jgi:hypothetical protein